MTFLLMGIATFTAALVWWVLFTRPSVTRRALQHIPELRFEENDTPERYLTDSRYLLRKGYDQYLRNGVPFQMRNPIGELGPQVILPMKYLDEVKYAPTSLFSFVLFSEKVFLLNYSDGPQQTDASALVVRTDLTRNLGSLAQAMYEEATAAFENPLSYATEWTSFPAYELFSDVTARVTALGLVGPKLCRNPEWIQISLQTTFAIFNAAYQIRKDYTPRWRWLARWQSDVPRQMRAMRARARELLAEAYQERASAQASGSTSVFHDCLYWLLGTKNSEKSLDRIVDQQLFLTVASMHTTSSSLVSTLYDLLSKIEYLPDILEEINAVSAECDGKWTPQHVAKLKRLDSFMKESQRVNPIGYITVQRLAVKSHTFKDGLHLPAGVVFQFAADAVQHDPSIYPNPDEFDGNRFLHLRETVDPNKFHFASVSDTMLGFGAGTHACPGRFFTGLAMKLILVALFTTYEIRLGGGGKDRPAGTPHDFNMAPSREATVELRRRIA